MSEPKTAVNESQKIPMWQKIAYGCGAGGGNVMSTLLASFLLRRLEKLLDGHASYELVREDPLVATAGTYNYPGKGSPYDEVNRERPQGARKEDAE